MDILTLLIVVPAVATAVMFFVPEKNKALVSTIPALAGSICLALSIRLFWTAWHGGLPGGELALAALTPNSVAWVPSLGITWSVAADGMSAAMCLLTSIVMLAGSLISVRSDKLHTGIGDRPKDFFILALVLSAR